MRTSDPRAPAFLKCNRFDCGNGYARTTSTKYKSSACWWYDLCNKAAAAMEKAAHPTKVPASQLRRPLRGSRFLARGAADLRRSRGWQDLCPAPNAIFDMGTLLRFRPGLAAGCGQLLTRRPCAAVQTRENCRSKPLAETHPPSASLPYKCLCLETEPQRRRKQ